MTTDTINANEEGIGKILHGLRGHSCAFYAETVKDGEATIQRGAMQVSSDGNTDRIPIGTLFGLGSLIKLFISVALFKIIEGRCTVGNAKKKRIMGGAWKRRALKVLNELREEDGHEPLPEPEHRLPTIEQLLCHSHAFISSQRHLIGPDGRIIICEETFGEILASLTDADVGLNLPGYHYSNWNYIVAGLIIKHATGLSLSEALKVLVLNPLKMGDTVIDMKAFDLKQDTIAKAFITTPTGECEQVSTPCYLRDDLDLAVGGGYSCVEDIAKLLRFLMEAFTNGDELLKGRFFDSDEYFKSEQTDSQSFLSGVRAPLDSELAGSESIEQALAGKYYNLGKRNGISVDAITKAGTIRGYSCHYYIIPPARLFLIVLTNSSGIVNPSHHIGQYILQEILKLDNRVDIGLEAPRILAMQSDIVRRSTVGLLPSMEFSASEMISLQATFTDYRSHKCIDIKLSDTNTLEVEVRDSRSTTTKSTTKMRLIKISEGVLAVVPDTIEASLDLYVEWRDFALEMRLDGETVQALHQISASSTIKLDNVPENGYKAVYERNLG